MVRRGPLHPHPGLITITGIDDHVRPEPVITFHRIERSSSTGIRDHVRPEHAYRPALFRLIIGGRSSSSANASWFESLLAQSAAAQKNGARLGENRAPGE
jgi:hypothetical protein